MIVLELSDLIHSSSMEKAGFAACCGFSLQTGEDM